MGQLHSELAVAQHTRGCCLVSLLNHGHVPQYYPLHSGFCSHDCILICQSVNHTRTYLPTLHALENDGHLGDLLEPRQV